MTCEGLRRVNDEIDPALTCWEFRQIYETLSPAGRRKAQRATQNTERCYEVLIILFERVNINIVSL